MVVRESIEFRDFRMGKMGSLILFCYCEGILLVFYRLLEQLLYYTGVCSKKDTGLVSSNCTCES